MTAIGEETLRAVIRRLRAPQAPPPPQGLPGDLCDRLETAFLTCVPDDAETLFIDTRLAPWRECLPHKRSSIDHARAMIDTLFTRYNAQEENALILFLTVLAERTNPADACHRRFCLLASELRHLLKPARLR